MVYLQSEKTAQNTSNGKPPVGNKTHPFKRCQTHRKPLLRQNRPYRDQKDPYSHFKERSCRAASQGVGHDRQAGEKARDPQKQSLQPQIKAGQKSGVTAIIISLLKSLKMRG